MRTFDEDMRLRDQIIAILQVLAAEDPAFAGDVISSLAHLVVVPELIRWAELNGYISLDDELDDEEDDEEEQP